MLWFVGLGISGLEGLSQEILKILKKADIVYLEVFTSPMRKPELSKLRKILKRKFRIAPRWLVEDGKTILSESKKNLVVLLSYGDPFVATTHIELRTRAIQAKIRTKTNHAASAITSIIGECGLHYYKMGKVVTIMKDKQSLSSVHRTLNENLLAGNHTLIILEFDNENKFFLKPNDAFASLIFEETENNRKLIDNSTYAIVASRIGLNNQRISSGKISNLINLDFGTPPHTIIIPGAMHFTEFDAIQVLSKCYDQPENNSTKIQKVSDQMLSKYIPKARVALKEASKIFKEDQSIQSVLENAGLYLDDAELFQNQGKEELAILSIGYAEGLIDALRFAKGLDPWVQNL